LSIINALGTVEAAAHGLGVRVESLAYLPGTAFQVAAATLAGQFLGAGDDRRAKRSVVMACLSAGILLSAAGLSFYFCGGWFTWLFLGQASPAVGDLTVRLLRIVAFSMPSLALMMVLSGALRGAGDTRWPLAFTFLGFLGIRIPLAYYLAWDEILIPWADLSIAGCGLSVLGAWYAMIIDVIVRSLLMLFRFLHGGWQRVDV
jgi:Na+-driven multidrug efflux pump